MKLLTKADELIKFVEWQQGADRVLEITIEKDKEAVFTLKDKETNETQSVSSFHEITINKEKKERVRTRDVNKFISKVNGSFYPFVNWMKKGDRKVTFVLEEGLTMKVYDNELEIGQTVEFLEQIDLFSEKILEIMTECTKLPEGSPKRNALLKEIAKLEMKKLV